ncbi:MAG: peptide chain release factor N(5)-glutamine methyltransferase [Planctomycetota bacterium]|nr:peptide chain release factor N(5)-glutamine methyltransferase [Planctomycetota bacterium]
MPDFSTPHLRSAVDAVLSCLEHQDPAHAAVARRFISDLFGIPSQTVSLDGELPLTEIQQQQLRGALLRLQNGEPLAYVAGEVGFFGHQFQVDQRVLIPRADSEVVVELCLKHLMPIDSPRVIDIGTGSGCLLLSILATTTQATGVGVDVSTDALELASKNVESLGLGDRAILQESDCFESVANSPGFDLIVSNPPYIVRGETLGQGVAEYEPHSALFVSNDDPIEFYRKIFESTADHLNANGVVVFEVGCGRSAEIEQLAHGFEFQLIDQARDLGQIVRGLVFKRAAEL